MAKKAKKVSQAFVDLDLGDPKQFRETCKQRDMSAVASLVALAAMFNPDDPFGGKMVDMFKSAAEFGRQDMERTQKLADELDKQGK